MAFETGITILVLCIVSLFFYLSYFGVCGKAGTIIAGLFFGIFGWLAWLLPAGIVISYTFAVVNRGDRRVPRKIISAFVALLSLASLLERIAPQQILTEFYISNHVLTPGFLDSLYLSLEDVAEYGKVSGGIVGRAIGDALSFVVGKWGAVLILAALVILCIYIFYGPELMASIRRRNAYREEMEEACEDALQKEEYREPSYRVIPHKTAHRQTFSPSGIMGINLQEVGAKLDKLEKDNMDRQKKQEPGEENDSEKSIVQDKITKGRRKNNAPDGMQEITASAELRNELPERSVKSADRQKSGPRPIPIYREEMEQKFGHSGQKKDSDSPAGPMASFVPKEEVTDIRPSSQIAAARDDAGTAEKAAGSGTKTAEMTARTQRKQVQSGSDRTAVPDAVQSADKTESEITPPVKPYQFPPLELLSLPSRKAHRISDEKLRMTAARLQQTLQSFNVEVEMGAVTCGPTVTRYEVLPAQGVRVNKITNLADDLKLSLAASNIRIEAPIPGKAAVGIEVPNEEASAVLFRELLEGEQFARSKSPVTFAVGKDIAGKIIMADIAKMPHLLIAGATGSGKSVCINTLIMSILYKSHPDDVKLIMIDPKVVELSVYNGIPHLFCPVVTDPKEAAAALNWAVREMMERYNKFKELGVRNIEGYNQKIQSVPDAAEAGYAKMPLLVIIVDEFADLMMVASKEVEDAVCRLAQLARAAGIHLILATQRPSVNVITGIIKANIPSRIAFSVASAVDSRTILDKGGAEKLLGKGDMLFFPSGYSEPVRLQGAFVSDKEVSDVVNFLCSTNESPVYNDKVTEIVENPDGDVREERENKPEWDEYFEEAGRFVIESERAAAGQLQRRFSIGFNRAGRIIDQLHKAGVVGPAVGTKPRQVLMTMEQFENYLGLGGEEGTPVAEEDFQAVADEFSGE